MLAHAVAVFGVHPREEVLGERRHVRGIAEQRDEPDERGDPLLAAAGLQQAAEAGLGEARAFGGADVGLAARPGVRLPPRGAHRMLPRGHAHVREHAREVEDVAGQRRWCAGVAGAELTGERDGLAHARRVDRRSAASQLGQRPGVAATWIAQALPPA